MRNRILLLIVALAIGLSIWLVSSLGGTPAQIATAPEPPRDAPAAAPTGATTDPAAETAPAREAVAAQAPAPDSAAAERPRPGPEELWGRVVVAGTDTPIAGAAVELTHRDADEFWNLDLDYGEQVTKLGSTTSDVDGRFRFAVPRARQHRIGVRASGYASVVVEDCTGGSEVVVEMSRGASVEGIVRCDGAPLPGIPIRIVILGTSIELATGTTGRDGCFRFAGLQPATVYVQVAPTDYSGKWARAELQPGELARIEVDLLRGRQVRGRVVEATTNAPIVGAEVSDSWTFRRRVQTDGEGNFQIAGLSDDGFTPLYVRARGYATASRNVAGELAGVVEFRLPRGGEVIGRIVAADRAAPRAAYAAIGASFMEAPGMEHTDWLRGEVEPDGRFRVLGLRPNQHYSLYVRAPGYGTRVYALPRIVGDGDRLDVGEVVMRPGGGAEGRVVDDAGAPLAAIEVGIRGTNSDCNDWLANAPKPKQVTQFHSRSVKTDGEGRFRFTGLAAGSYVVSVRPPGHNQAHEHKLEVEDGGVHEGIEFVIARGKEIAGTLIRADGKPLGSDTIILEASTERHEMYSCRPDADGHFCFRGLHPGTYTVRMVFGPGGWSMQPRANVTAGTTDLNLVLVASEYITGRVVDAAGRGVKARVYAQPDDVRGGVPLHATDDDGAFRVPVVPGFRGKVGARGVGDDELRAGPVPAVAGQADLQLELR